MAVWSAMASDDVDRDALVATIRSAGRPLHSKALSRAAAQRWWALRSRRRIYAPSGVYNRGEVVEYDAQAATVTAVTQASNPKQGTFSILTLTLPDRTARHVAAGVPGAPPEPPSLPSRAASLPRISANDERGLRTVVRKALSTDGRFASSENAQGEHWCLREILPAVTELDRARALKALPSRLEESEPVTCATAELVAAAWNLQDDSSEAYALHAFALSLALVQHKEVRPLAGRWIRTADWLALTARDRLRVPRVPTRELETPDGVVVSSEGRTRRVHRPVGLSRRGVERPPADEPDLESWRLGHPSSALFALNARHYYEGWLPLTKRLRPLFPPFQTGRQELLVHHHFGDEAASFRVWLDQRGACIWLSKAMYETLRADGVYPGARLQLTARNEREYDLATRPAGKDEPIRVWRMWLEGGKLCYGEACEPRRYDVVDHVHVADVCFEDLPALFRRAAEVGNSVFPLLYNQAAARWEAGGRENLYVTAEDLYAAIRSDPRGRMATRASIAWELWQRLAFHPVGGGRYRFRPEFGACRRLAVPGAMGRAARALAGRKTPGTAAAPSPEPVPASAVAGPRANAGPLDVQPGEVETVLAGGRAIPQPAIGVAEPAAGAPAGLGAGDLARAGATASAEFRPDVDEPQGTRVYAPQPPAEAAPTAGWRRVGGWLWTWLARARSLLGRLPGRARKVR